MKIDFDFSELLTISCALHTLDIVYGSNLAREAVMARVDALLDIMNNTSIDQLYPKACEGVVSGNN